VAADGGTLAVGVVTGRATSYATGIRLFVLGSEPWLPPRPIFRTWPMQDKVFTSAFLHNLQLDE
jgi:hypothetical protein